MGHGQRALSCHVRIETEKWIKAWLEGLRAGLQRRCEPPVACQFELGPE